MEVLEKLKNIDTLPTIPLTVQKVLQALETDDISAQELEEIIKDDQALAAKILKVSNSPLYRGGQPVVSLRQAIMRLGFVEVKNITLALALTQFVENSRPFEEFDLNNLWLHAVVTARAAEYLGKELSSDTEALYTAGLLHDIGRFIIYLYLPEDFARIFKLSREESLSLTEAEGRFGVSHAEVGAYLAESWNFPEPIVKGIRWHHQPTETKDSSNLAGLIYVADAITYPLGLGGDPRRQQTALKVPRSLGLTLETIKKVARKLAQEKEELIISWGTVFTA
ncbi:HDOD domain-containing protein [Thermosulfuriphilus sp.]